MMPVLVFNTLKWLQEQNFFRLGYAPSGSTKGTGFAGCFAYRLSMGQSKGAGGGES
jgi:hypothetical protein